MAPTYSSASFGDYGRKPIQSAQAELINAAELEHDASLFAGRANSFTCPLGDTPGYGYLLMQRKHVLELHQEFIDQGNTALEKDLQIGIDWIFVDALAAVRPKWITLQHLILVNATRVYPGYEEDENSIMLVEVADVRYWLKKSFIDTQYNVRCITETTDDKYWTPSLKVDTENTGEDAAPCQYGCRPWTWREVLQDIWEHFPEEYQDLVPELPVLYDDLWDAIPERLTFNSMSALTAYCETLRLAGGAALGFDPVAYEFRIVIPGGLNTDTEFDTLKTSYRKCLAKKQEVLSNSPVFIPDLIRVVFEAVYDTRDVEEFFLKPKYSIEIPFANYIRDNLLTGDTSIRSKTGTVEIINAKKDAIIRNLDAIDCTCPELPPEPVDPDEPGFINPQNLDRVPLPENYVDLEECAKQLAYRFWDHRLTDEPTELLYEGCLPFRHGDKVFQVTWRNIDHQGWQTRLEYHRALKEFFDVVTTPFRELRSQAGCDPASDDLTCQEVYGPEILTETQADSEINSEATFLIYRRPAYMEFLLSDFFYEPIYSVDPATDTITGATVLSEGELIRFEIAASNHILPAPLDADTVYFVRNPIGTTFQVSETADGSIIDITDVGFGDFNRVLAGPQVIRLWFHTHRIAGSGGSSRWAVYVSEKFAVRYQNTYRWGYFTYIAPAIGLVVLSNDYDNQGASFTVGTLYLSLMFANIVYATPTVTGVAIYTPVAESLQLSGVGQSTSLIADDLADRRVRLTNRRSMLQGATPLTELSYVLPIASLPKWICLIPKKYPPIFEDERPLAQLWDGTPPPELYVSFTGYPDQTLTYLVTGKLDQYSYYSVGTATAPASGIFFVITAKIDGLELNRYKLVVHMHNANSASIGTQLYVDFSNPLDVTIIDDLSRTLRIRE